MERFKLGSIREDGYIFWQYHTGREIWLSPEKFKIQREKHRAARVRWYAVNSEKQKSITKAWRISNKEKCYAINQKWCQKNKEKAYYYTRKSRLKRSYKLTPEGYEQMLENQSGGCAICGDKCSSGRRLAVDHDHNTQKVRGLLCGACNRGIGLLKDDPSLAKKASEYLLKHRMLDSTCVA
jgi:hypothetical protein